jgi:hypothetical protein
MVSNNSQQPAMAELEDDCESGACAIWFYEYLFVN